MSISHMFGSNVSKLNYYKNDVNEVEKEKKTKLLERWVNLGLNKDWFNNDYESAKFLMESKLIFTIIALANSSDHPDYSRGLRYDKSGLQILKNGNYVPVKEIIRDIRYEGGRFLDQENTSWTYIGKYGFIPIDSWNYQAIFPVTRLTKGQLQQLMQHSGGDKFKNCFVQVVTNPRGLIGKVNKKWKNDALINMTHVGMRLIDNQGYVYSFGLHASAEEMKYRNTKGTFFASINGTAKMIDYEEPRHHEGRVTTTCAIPEKEYYDLFHKLDRLQKKGIRVDIMDSNCAYFSRNMLQTVGLAKDLKLETDVVETIADMYAIKVSVPVIGSFCRSAMGLICNGVLALTGRYQGSPMAEDLAGKEDGFTDNKTPALNLAKPPKLHHSHRVIQWQLQQKNTYVHPYTAPSMSVIPSKNVHDQREAAKLKQQLKPFYN